VLFNTTAALVAHAAVQINEHEKKKAYAAELQAQMQERQAQRQQERLQRFGGPGVLRCMQQSEFQGDAGRMRTGHASACLISG
jgi:hypothetical protein